MRFRTLAIAAAIPALMFGSGAALASNVAIEQAYPYTKPSAGQFCKKADRGVITTAANGRRVRCAAETTSRSRWVYR